MEITKTATVMVVEDEALLSKAILKKLRLAGLEVVSCREGQQALNYLQDFPDLPDIIWLDYYLTDMTGLDFVKKLKENPAWANIPVVVISNSAAVDKVQELQALGIKEYLIKAEHRLDDIIATIRKYV